MNTTANTTTTTPAPYIDITPLPGETLFTGDLSQAIREVHRLIDQQLTPRSFINSAAYRIFADQLSRTVRSVTPDVPFATFLYAIGDDNHARLNATRRPTDTLFLLFAYDLRRPDGQPALILSSNPYQHDAPEQ